MRDTRVSTGNPPRMWAIAVSDDPAAKWQPPLIICPRHMALVTTFEQRAASRRNQRDGIPQTFWQVSTNQPCVTCALDEARR